MSSLTEPEIFDCLITHFHEAATLCEKMAAIRWRGAQYRRLIEVCGLIEGACRQAGHWRENHEWFILGRDVHTLQLKMGEWMRAYLSPASQKRAKASFTMAAKTMRRLEDLAKRKKDAKHGRSGLILPVPGEGPLRDRPVQVPRMTPGGIYLS